ncbi:MAG: hypothetical protein AAGD05_16315, partial [Bacteroidota bacterium]
EIELPYTDKAFSIEEYQVDNQGNVYLLALIFQDGKQRKKGRPNYHYSILAYNNNGEGFEEYPISLEDQFITDLTFRIANNGQIVCSGFYSDKGTTSIRGTYFFRLDPKTSAVLNKNAKDFDFKFLTANVSGKRLSKYMDAERSGKKNKQAELEQYALDHLILRNDGGALLVAEQYFVEEYVDRANDFFIDPYFNNRNFADSYNYFYNYNDIIVVNIRPNGEIQWTARIPKQQSTPNDNGYFSSYAMSIVRDKIYFIYNDNERNFDSSTNQLYEFRQNESVIALSQLSTNGSIKTYPIFNVKGANVLTRPKVCRQTGRKEMVIYGENGKKFKFANLQFL